MSQEKGSRDVGEASASHDARYMGLIVYVCALVGLSFGLSYKVYNQHSYLLGGLRRLRPDFLPRDWVLNETTIYHSYFEWIIVGLGTVLGTGDGLGWGLALLQWVVIAATFGSWALLARRLTGGWQEAFAPTALLGLWMVGQLHYGPAFSYLTGYGMQPSTLSALGMCWALALNAMGRKGWAGLALALGGLFHTNFLVLGLLVFGLAAVAETLHKRKLMLKEHLGMMAPSLAVFATTLPLLLEVSGQDERGMMIFQTIRAPWHYSYDFYASTTWPFFGWTVLGALGLAFLRKHATSHRDVYTRLGWLWLSLHVSVFGYLVCVVSDASLKVTQLFLWRLAPFASMLSVVALVFAIGPMSRALMRLSEEGGDARRARVEVAAVALVALTLFWIGTVSRPLNGYLVLPFSIEQGLGLWSGAVLFRMLVETGKVRMHETLFRIATVAALTVMTWTSVFHHSNAPEFGLADTSRQEIYEWIAQNTPNDALFVIPPRHDAFRLYAERSVIADWKTSPVLPNEVLEWYGRMEVLSGYREPKWTMNVEAGYSRIDAGRMRYIMKHFGPDHALVYAKSMRALRGFEVLHRNDHWVVLRLR